MNGPRESNVRPKRYGTPCISPLREVRGQMREIEIQTHAQRDLIHTNRIIPCEQALLPLGHIDA